MTILDAGIYGIVEGFTEFLPVSSTAHLILLSSVLGIPQNQFTGLFEVVIQAGAILAVVFLYIQYILKHRQVLTRVLYSFIPTAIVGFILHDIIKNVFFKSNSLMAIALISVGALFLIAEYFIAQKKLKLEKGIEKMSAKDAVIIGLCQSLAVVPGVSRAGAVIVSMIFLKYKRTDAAIYSFLLAVPTILAASVLDLLKTDPSILNGANVTLLIVGSVVSFIFALVFVRWLLKYLQNNTLNLFAIYRIALGAILLLFFQHL